MKIRNYIFLLIGLSIFSSCEEEYLTPLKLIKWVESNENGLIAEKEINEYRFSTIFKPLDYIVAKNLDKDEISEEELLKEKTEIEDLQYYTYRIGLTSNQGDLLKNNLRETNEYYARIEYFSFAMQNDLVLVDGSDTLKCVLYHFERIYGAAPYLNFSVAFENENNNKNGGDKTLILNDQILGTGRVKLTIPHKNIIRTPQLKTS